MCKMPKEGPVLRPLLESLGFAVFTALVTKRPYSRTRPASRQNVLIWQRGCMESEESLELGEYGGVGLALERHDIGEQLVGRQPAPLGKFGVGGLDRDLAILALKTCEEPFLLLPPIPPLPHARGQIRGEVVAHPIRCLGLD